MSHTYEIWSRIRERGIRGVHPYVHDSTVQIFHGGLTDQEVENLNSIVHDVMGGDAKVEYYFNGE